MIFSRNQNKIKLRKKHISEKIDIKTKAIRKEKEIL